MSTWVLTPCHRVRLDELKTMLASIAADPAHVVVVTTLPNPILTSELAGHADHVLLFEKPGMLFGEWFNAGFEHIAGIERDDDHEILCIGSSLLGDWSTIDWLAKELRGNELTMVGPDLQRTVPPGHVEQHQYDTRNLSNRVPAQCFMVAGELGLRFDPQFRWWYSDDDLEMQARQLGPVAIIGGMNVIMTHPDGHYLSEQQANWAIEDRAKFVTKWQREPW